MAKGGDILPRIWLVGLGSPGLLSRARQLVSLRRTLLSEARRRWGEKADEEPIPPWHPLSQLPSMGQSHLVSQHTGLWVEICEPFYFWLASSHKPNDPEFSWHKEIYLLPEPAFLFESGRSLTGHCMLAPLPTPLKHSNSGSHFLSLKSLFPLLES